MKIFALNILGYLVTSSDVQLGKSAHIVNALLKARWWCYDTIHQVISIFGENPSWQSLFSDKRSVECTVQSRFSDTTFSGNLLFSGYFCIVESMVLMLWHYPSWSPFAGKTLGDNLYFLINVQLSYLHIQCNLIGPTTAVFIYLSTLRNQKLV